MGLQYRDLTVDQAERIVACLEPLVSPARQARIEAVLARRTREVVLVLEEVFVDHNRAAVLRTADAFGLVEVHHVSQEGGDFKLSRRVALGSEKWMELCRHRDLGAALRTLQARGYEVWAAAVHDAAAPLEAIPVDRPVALLFGNEHDGLSAEAKHRADRTFFIPMVGFAESFNISVAAALALQDQMRRRGAGDPVRGAGHLAPDDRARLRACWFATSVRAASGLLEQAGLPMPVMSSARLEYTE